jgi:hypothetical protein
MGVVDDRTSEFLEEVWRAMEARRAESGLPPASDSVNLADVIATAREAGIAAALNKMTAAALSSSVSP